MHKSPEHHIELKTAEKLDPDMVKLWAGVVRRNGPAGIMVSTDIMRGRELINTRFYAIKGASGTHYVIPLARDLTDTEVSRIAHEWDRQWSGGDFVINWSQDDGMRMQQRQVQSDARDTVAETAAKLNHTAWYDDLTNQGWTWSTRYSTAQKMHPNLRPWHELPEKIRSRERDKFAKLLGVLEAMDLQITHR